MEEQRGAEIAKGIHGCLWMFLYPIVGICIGAFVWTKWGWAPGILGGLGGVILFAWLVSHFNRPKGLSQVDCLLPLLFSVLSGVAFFPVSLLAGNLFSPATCIVSGLLLTLQLFGYRSGRIKSPWWLLLPAATFVYEMLPIDLPTDIDNFLACGANSMLYFCSCMKLSPKTGTPLPDNTEEPKALDECGQEEDTDVIDV
jgi:hypothetical protein